jgi:hypothetical protein
VPVTAAASSSRRHLDGAGPGQEEEYVWSSQGHAVEAILLEVFGRHNVTAGAGEGPLLHDSDLLSASVYRYDFRARGITAEYASRFIVLHRGLSGVGTVSTGDVGRAHCGGAGGPAAHSGTRPPVRPHVRCLGSFHAVAGATGGG